MGWKRLSRKRWSYIIVAILLICAIMRCIGPIAFARDGVLTRKKVTEYKMQYELGATRRHGSQVSRIYLFYFGFQNVSVQKEKLHEGYDVKSEQLLPFLYRWNHEMEEDVFRVTIGEKKYYYTIVST